MRDICKNALTESFQSSFFSPFHTLFWGILFYIFCISESCIWLFATPWTVACQAPLSIEFFRQEHWSVLSTLLQAVFPIHGSNTVSHSLSSEPPGKSKNVGVGSLSLIQGIFLTQGLNRVSCIASRFFTSWAIREALCIKVYD